MAHDSSCAPIFIIGTGRSGTTLMRQMLNAHSRIYITHEASFYLNFHMKGLSKPYTPAQWLDRYCKTLSFCFLDVSRSAVFRELDDHPGPVELKDAFRAVMRAKARKVGRPRYGDKTPSHSLYLKQIFRDFPDARVVHVVRDPRGTVASLMRMPWASSSIGGNTFYCALQLRAIKPFRDRILEVRIEDLVADPAATMQRVLSFVGEPWEDAVIEHDQHPLAADVPPFPWFANAKDRPRTKSRTMSAGWQKQLSPEWIRDIENANREVLALYGYSRAELPREPGLAARLKSRALDAVEILRSIKRYLSLARFWARSAKQGRQDLQQELEMFLGLNPGAWKHYPGFTLPRIPEPGRFAILPKQVNGNRTSVVRYRKRFRNPLSLTALYTSQAARWAGLPNAELFDFSGARVAFRTTNAFLGLMRLFRPGVISLRESVVHRQLMFDRVLQDTRPRQILELAAGLSRRGATWSAVPTLRYVEVDLPEVIQAKQDLLNLTSAGRQVLQRPNYHLVAGDVLETDLGALIDVLLPTTVICEGLHMYLTHAQQLALWGRLGELLAQCPQADFVFDLGRPEEPRVAGNSIAKRLMISIAKRGAFVADNRSLDEVKEDLSTAGFRGPDLFEVSSVAHEWQLPCPEVDTNVKVYCAEVSPACCRKIPRDSRLLAQGQGL